MVTLSTATESSASDEKVLTTQGAQNTTNTLPDTVALTESAVALRPSFTGFNHAPEAGADDIGLTDLLDATNTTPEKPIHLVVIDGQVNDIDTLLGDITIPDNATLETLILDPNRDGLLELTDTLNGLTNVSAVHIVSHGANGVWELGQAQITADTIDKYHQQLSSWSNALLHDADILLYGCDLAASESGIDLLEAISNTTGADIAASTDDTGHATLEGNWELEYTIGEIETTVVFSDVTQNSWNSKLAISANLIGHWTLNGNVIDSSSTGNDGIFHNPSYQAVGDGTQAADFSNDPAGNNLRYVEIPGNTAYSATTGDFTISFWFQRTGVTPIAELFSASDGIDSIRFFYLDNDNSVYWTVSDGDGSATLLKATIPSSGWHLVTATRTGDSFQLYLNDGPADDSQALANVNADLSSATISLGAINPTSQDFDGNIKDVRIYDSALSATDNDELFTNTSAPPPTLNFTAPNTVTVNEDTTLNFTGTDTVQVDDGITNNTIIQVAISVENGVLNFPTTNNLTIYSGANNSANIVLDGLESDINAALSAMQFIPDPNYSGSTTLTIELGLNGHLNGYYSFESNDVADTSYGNVLQHGTLAGGASVTNDVDRGNVLSLDGINDYVVIPSEFDQPNSVSIGGWVNLAAGSGQAEFISIDDRVLIRLDQTSGVNAYFANTATWEGLTSGISIAGTGWRHVFYSVNAGGSHTLYIDGVAVASASTSNYINWGSASETLIGKHRLDSNFLSGRVDNIRIHTRAVSADEVLAYYNETEIIDDNIQIDVLPINDAPIIDLDANNSTNTGINYSGGFVEANGLATITDTDVSITDVDSTALSSSTITITNLLDGTNESLSATLPDNTWSASYDNTLGTLEISKTGGAIISDWVTVYESIRYNNTSQDPNTTTRIITVEGHDGVSTNNPLATASIDISPVNNAPIITIGGNPITTVGGTIPITAAMLSEADPDDNGIELTYTVTSISNGLLRFIDTGATVTSFTPDDIDDNNLEFVHDGLSTQNGIIELTLVDGGEDSVSAAIDTLLITVIGALPDLYATNEDSDLSIGTNSGLLTNDTQSVSASVIGVDDSLTNGSVSVNPDGSFLYQHNGAHDYLADGQSTTDSFDYTFDDGNGNQQTVTATINIDGLNDQPALSNLENTTATYIENTAGVVLTNSIAITDIDDSQIETATVTITNNLVSSEDLLSLAPQSNITGSYSIGTGTLTLTGPATAAEFEMALRAVTYQNTNNNTSTLTRTIEFAVNDGAADSTALSRQVEILPLNEPPVISINTGASSIAGATTLITGTMLNEADPDDDGIELTYSVTSESNGHLEFISNPGVKIPYFTQLDIDSNNVVFVHDELTIQNGSFDFTLADGGENLIEQLLNQDPTLSYDAVTNKFYRFVDTPMQFSQAVSAATTDLLNGVAGQLITIDSAYENQIVHNWVTSSGNQIWIGASDASNEGDWNWLSGTTESTRTFWTGGSAGSAVPGEYASTMNLSDLEGEDYLRMIDNGRWNDQPNSGPHSYVVEWDAATIPVITATDTFNVTVTGALPDAYTINENIVSYSINSAGGLLANDSNGTAPFVAGTDTTNTVGNVTVNTDGSFTYSPQSQFAALNVGQTATDTFDYTYDDGTGIQQTVTATITLNGINHPPTLSGLELSNATYTENTPATALTSNLSLADVDNAQISTATISISNNFIAAQDSLTYSNQPGISGNYDPNNGVLTLTGPASKTDFETAIRAIGYINNSDDPSASPRQIEFIINDGDTDSVAHYRDIDIIPINDAPAVTTNIAASSTIGGTASITTAMLNEGDPDDDGLELTYSASSVVNGQLELINNAGVAVNSFTQADIDNGNLVFVHDGLTSNNGQFDFSLADGGEDVAAPAVGSFIVDVTGALPDAYTTDEDTTLNITAPGLLANDSNPATSSVTSIDTTTTVGAVSHNTDGSFSYLPQGAFESLQPGQTATDTFSYTFDDGLGYQQNVDVTITVNGINDAPMVTTNIAASSTIGGTAFITIAMLNEGDPDDDGLELTYSASSVVNGQLELINNAGVAVSSFTQADINNGNLVFVHDGLTSNNGQFDFSLADGGEDGAAPAVGSFIVDITGALPDAYTTDEDTTLNITAPGLLANDSSPATSSVTSIDTTTTIGAVSHNTDGSFSYQPQGVFDSLQPGQTATDTFSYTFDDGLGYQQNVDVTITVNSINDAPMVTTNIGASSTVGGTASITTAMLNEGDPDDDGLELTYSASSVVNGQLELINNTGVAVSSFTQADIDNGNLVFVHDGLTSNNGQFDFSLADGGEDVAAPAVGSFIVDVTGALPDAYTTDEDTTLNITAPGLLANDSSPATSSVTSIDTTTTIGSVLHNTDGSFSYQPQGVFDSLQPGQTATDTFSYTFDDGLGYQQNVDVTITVNGINDTPGLASIETSPATYLENGSIAITDNLSLADADDTQIESATISISNNFVAAEDLLSFTNQLGISGNYNALSGVLTLTGPAAVTDFETAIRTVTYSNNSDDPTTSPRQIEFIINDGHADSVAQYRDIDIIPINDAPAVINNIGASSTVGGTAFITIAMLNEGDPDDDGLELTYSASSVVNGQLELINNAGVAVSSFTQADIDNGNLVFVHDGLTSNNGQFDFSLADGGEDGATPAVGSFIVDVTGALPDAYTTDEDTTLNITAPGLLANDSSPATSSVTSIDTTTTVGAVSHNTDGSFSYLPQGAFESLQPGQTATDTFSYTFDDGLGYQQNVDVTITVNGINDAPMVTTNIAASSTIGGTAFITIAMLNEGDPDDDGLELTYSASSVVNGQLELINNAGVAVNSFTQADIDNGNLVFVHDGLTANNGSFDFSLADGGEDGAAPAVGSFIVDVTGALPDAYTTDEDTTLNITALGLLANDSSPATSSVTSIDTTTTVGAVSHNTDGSFSYLPQGAFESLQPGQTATDTFSYTFDDGLGYQQNVDVTITVNGINDAPGLASIETSPATYLENGSIAITDNLSLADADDTQIESATISISNNFVAAEDLLSFTNQLGISGNYNALSGVLTLTGPAAVTDFETAIRTVTYSNNSDDPTTSPRQIEFIINDGDSNSNVPVRDINVTNVNDAPVIAINTGADSLVGGATTITTAMLNEGDVDDNGNGLNYTINSINNGQLELGSNPGVAITGFTQSNIDSNLVVFIHDGQSMDDGSFDFTLSDGGEDGASVANDIFTVSVTGALPDYYSTNEDTTLNIAANGLLTNDAAGVSPFVASTNTSNTVGIVNSNPDGSFSYQPNGSFGNLNTGQTATDTFDYIYDDGQGIQHTTKVTITITGTNDQPIVSSLTTSPAYYTEGGSPVGLTDNVLLTDIDNITIESAIISISNNFKAPEDNLIFSSQPGISGSYDDNSGTLTLTGPASLADFEAAINSIAYINTSNDPSILTRTLAITINDGTVDSSPLYRDIEIIPFNNPPAIAINTGADTTVGGTVTITGAMLNEEDPDDDSNELTYTATANNGQLELTNNPGVAVSSFTQADIDSESVIFVHDGLTSQNGSFTLSLADGGENNAAPANDTFIIEVTGPLPDNYTTDEDTPLVIQATGLLTNDSLGDGAFVAGIDSTTTLGSVSAAADGSFNYQPSNAFEALNAGQTGTDSFDYIYDDGNGNTQTAKATITISGVNDAPSIQNVEAAHAHYNENSAPEYLTNNLTITDSDNTLLDSATISIDSNFSPDEDTLSYSDQSNITGSYNALTGVLTLTGPATSAEFALAIRSITYNNTSDSPLDLPRTIGFVVNDSASNSTTVTREIVIHPSNDAPILADIESTPVSYTENDQPTPINQSLSITDIDDTTIDSAIVTIDGGFSPGEDILNFSSQSGITGIYNPFIGTLTLTGTATVSDYQAALRSITFANTSDDPLNQTRTISFTVTDSLASSNILSRDINIAVVNDAPTITSIEPFAASYIENASAINITDSVLLSDLDNTQLEGATITISNNYTANEDKLIFSDQLGISGSFNPVNGSLTLTGSATIADYQTALKSVSYQNVSDNPSALVRTVDFYISDGSAVSNIGSRNIEVVSVNDSPQGTDTSVTFLEDTTYSVSVEDFGFSDPLDNNNIQGIVISGLPASGTLSLAGNPVSTGQLITTSDITTGNLTFTPDQNENGIGYSTLRFLVVDDGDTENNGSNIASSASDLTFSVINVNDAPSGTDSTISIQEDTTYTFTKVDFGFTDPKDNDQFIALTIITPPEIGSFRLGNTPVSAGTIIDIADIDEGKLQYTPPTNTFGLGYSGFSFLVHDSGGNTNNGAHIDETENYINFDFPSVNDAPLLINEGMTIDEGNYRIIDTNLLNATDVDNSASELTFTLNSLPSHGSLTLLGATLNAGDTFTLEQLQENLIYYTHDGSESSNDHFDIQVNDTAEDGTLPVIGRFQITINEVIDPAPAIDNESFTLKRGQAFDTSTGDQLTSGAIALAGTPLTEDPLLIIAIETQPIYGTVTINEDGTFTYLHDGSTNYTDSFSYRVTNQDGSTAIATVDVSIEPLLASAISSLPDVPTPVTVDTELEATEEIAVEETVTQEKEETLVNTIYPDLPGAGGTSEATPNSESATVIQIQNEHNEYNNAISPSAYNNLAELEVKKHNNVKYTLIDNQNFTFTTATIQVLTDVTVSRVSEAVSNKNFLDGLQQFEQDLEQSDTKEKRAYSAATDTAIGASIGTTAGVLAWALRGGALFASVMAATPLWSNIDPVRVTGDKLVDKEKRSGSDKVEQYFEN